MRFSAGFGGAKINITGSGFSTGADVTVCGEVCVVSYVSSGIISCTVPSNTGMSFLLCAPGVIFHLPPPFPLKVIYPISNIHELSLPFPRFAQAAALLRATWLSRTPTLRLQPALAPSPTTILSTLKSPAFHPCEEEPQEELRSPFRELDSRKCACHRFSNFKRFS